MSTAPQAVRGRRTTGAIAGALGLTLLAGLIPLSLAPAAIASTDGTATTAPLTGTLSPLKADGTVSGQLKGKVDLPVLLGDIGSYVLPGLTAPAGDTTGNGLAEAQLPAGPIDGVITDPEDGDVDSDPGRGIDITGGSDSVVRTPAGLRSTTELRGLTLNIAELNDKVGAVLGRDVIATADRVITRGAAHVNGASSVTTSVEGLTLLGEQVALVDGRLPSDVSRTSTVQSNDVVALLRSLGVDEEDISQYAGLVSSSSLDGTFTLTASTPATGGLRIVGSLQMRIRASMVAGLGAADLQANNVVLDVLVGAAQVQTPSAIAPRGLALELQQAEPGTSVGITGVGLVIGATEVTIGGTVAEVSEVADNGSSLRFTIPAGLAGGMYTVRVATPGGALDAGRLKVLADDVVPLTVTGVTPASAPDGSTVTVSGTGFTPDATSVEVTDADGVVARVTADAVQVIPSGLSLDFRLPEGLALGTAKIRVTAAGESGETSIQVVSRVLPPVPSTGSAAVIGMQSTSTPVALTVDNSGTMTWSAPVLNNPAGPSGSQTVLELGLPTLGADGRGDITDSAGGIAGQVTRELTELRATATGTGYGLGLPAAWGTFFNTGNVVTADRIAVAANVTTGGTTATSVQLQNLRVLGNPVTLVDGRLQTAQEFTITRDTNDLKARRAMNGLFFSDEKEAYDRQKSATSATLWVRVEPVAATSGAGNATASAFRVVASVKYNYEGENGGFLKTRARHGTGGNRDGVRVDFFSAQVAQVSVGRPDAVAPEVLRATPNLVDAGDEIVLSGRGFSSDARVVFGGAEITPSLIAADGTSLRFLAPVSAEPGLMLTRVRTGVGTSASDRTITVMGAPSFTEHPESVTTRTSQPVTFTAAAAGYPAPGIRWQREIDGAWTDIEGATGESYSFTPSFADSGSRFRAVATNAKDSVVSNAATLSYETAPVITAPPAAGSWRAGDTALFSVEYDANPVATVSWQINRGGGWIAIPNASGPQLSMVVQARDHDALVRAIVRNAIGETSSATAQLWVGFDPEVTTQPVATSVRAGATASFTAAATGNPLPSVRWQYRMPLGGEWIDVDSEAYPSALTGTLSIPALVSFDGLLFRAMFRNSPDVTVPSTPVALTVLPAVTEPEPGAEGLSALASPLRLDASALVATGSASGGNLSGLVNAELSKGVEVGEPGTFFLAELGTPASPGTLEKVHPAGVALGPDSGDLEAGSRYGEVLVRNVWDSEGMRSTVTVPSITVDHLALDDKGRIGALLGLDEILSATDVTASAYAPSDTDFSTTTTARIGTLRVLGEELDAADGFVNGRLTAPITRERVVQVDDPAVVMERIGVNIGSYLTEPLLGSAKARIIVTVSQPSAREDDTATVTGLLVTARAEFEVELETQGVDRGIIETAQIATAGLGDLIGIQVARTAAARNGAELPEPATPGNPGGPGGPDPGGPEIPDLPVDSYTPTATPDRVVTTLTGDAATTRTLTWRTSPEVTSAVVEYRPAAGGEVVQVPATTRGTSERKAEQKGETAQYEARTHTGTLTGLSPATAYSFRVGDGGSNWSPWREFTTAAAGSQPFEFLYVGDAQNDIRAKWAGAAREMYDKTPDARLVIHAGDLINNADNDLQWGEWFGADPDSVASVLQVPVPGNHEYLNGRLYEPWGENFTLPKNGPQVDPTATSCEQAYQRKMSSTFANAVYYVDYQGVRFISLAGTLAMSDLLPTAGELAEAGCTAEAQIDVVKMWAQLQADWLDKALETNPGRWAVASIHQPIFSTSVGRDNPHIRAAWLPVFEKHNIDLVLQGHDHTYARGYLAQNEVPGQPKLQTGPVYTVAVLGPKMYDLDMNAENNWTLNAARRVTAFQDTRSYQRVSVDGGRLSYKAYKYDSGEVIDSFEICKNAEGDKLVADDPASLPTDCETSGNPGGPGEPGEGEPAPGTVPAPKTAEQLDAAGAGGIKIVSVDGPRVVVELPQERVGEWVAPYVHSSPTFLGWQKVGADRRITLTLPNGLEGSHRLAVLDRNGGLIGWQALQIDRASDGTARAALASTGVSDTMIPFAVGGALLLLMGAVTVLFGSRRRRGAAVD
ncbi:MAG: hypothetical protein DI534_14725 [Leifsonia xyli]|nr:MAG: hypothetical protein DI534_14725 [Leifsonia xyli]